MINPVSKVCDQAQVQVAETTLPATGEYISFEPLAPYPDNTRLALYYWTNYFTAGWTDTQSQLRCVAPNNNTGIIYCPVVPGSVSYMLDIFPKLVMPASASDCTLYHEDPSSYYCASTTDPALASKMFCSGRYKHWLNGAEVQNSMTGAFGVVPPLPWAYIPKSSTPDGGPPNYWVNLAFFN